MIAISIGDAPDRGRLGYPQREVDRVLVSICTALVRAGARVVYGGNLDPSGFTFKIFRHLAQAFAVRGSKPPFVHVIPEPVLRRANFNDLASTLREARGTVETTVALADERVVTLQPWDETERSRDDAKIRIVPDRASGPDAKIDSGETLQQWLGPARASPIEAFSAARRVMNRLVAGRVVMGGKMGLVDRPSDRYEGKYPGVIEEAILALQDGQALVTLGAFGGAARDLAVTLGLLDDSARVPRGEQAASYLVALNEVRELKARIPSAVRESLSEIAKDDRAEPLSYATVRVLERWQV